MKRLISGVVAATEGSTVVLETAGGVGYAINVPTRLLVTPQATLRLFTHLAVRENALDLYGFTTEAELACFSQLLTITGIGPKSALLIMDQAPPTLLYEAIRLEDPAHLTKLSGISKKTAEKIIYGLKDKVLVNVEPAAHTISSSIYQDAFDTLITLGYNPMSVRQTLESLPANETTSALVATALKRLSS